MFGQLFSITDNHIFVNKVFGIRHHGPGSTKSLLKALEAMSPDALLIEGPPDADNILRYAQHEGMVPPVALLVYDPKNLGKAAYFPFADFSPEWQAIRFALSRNIPVEFMDLPMYYQFGDLFNKDVETLFEVATKKDAVRLDPLGFMAKLAGYEDRERWWEVMFERSANEVEVFDAILEMMESLRAATQTTETTETLVREAYMRQKIREMMKKGFDNIAIVCGAWHAPALHNLNSYKAASDNAYFKGKKKVKTQSTWIPWTYSRLATASGYGAGVVSPAWYEKLYADRVGGKDALQHWMIDVARLFREEGFDVSSAHVIEAVRLSETLAAMRGLAVPGLDEMAEAVTSVFCNGEAVRLGLVEKQLIIGEKIGDIPDDMPIVPLQQDLEQRIKSASLGKYWRVGGVLWLKADKKYPKGRIDLREPADLAKSQLLHQLNVLGIHWGERHETRKAGTRSSGSQHESWKLHWSPELVLQTIEASVWGNTIHAAAQGKALDRAEKAETLSELTAMVTEAVFADLAQVVPRLVGLFQHKAAETFDVAQLLDALPELVKLARYGNVRQVDIVPIQMEINEIVPRICVGLPGACININHEVGSEMLKRLSMANYYLGLLNDAGLMEIWGNVLEDLATGQLINQLVRGGCARFLFDKNKWPAEAIAREMSLALSSANDTAHAAHWLEGFLQGSGLLLVHHLALWDILDQWVDALQGARFTELLPLLRRTFANFTPAERQKMLQMAQGAPQQAAPQLAFSAPRAEKMRPTVMQLLGMGG